MIIFRKIRNSFREQTNTHADIQATGNTHKIIHTHCQTRTQTHNAKHAHRYTLTDTQSQIHTHRYSNRHKDTFKHPYTHTLTHTKIQIRTHTQTCLMPLHKESGTACVRSGNKFGKRHYKARRTPKRAIKNRKYETSTDLCNMIDDDAEQQSLCPGTAG